MVSSMHLLYIYPCFQSHRPGCWVFALFYFLFQQFLVHSSFCLLPHFFVPNTLPGTSWSHQNWSYLLPLPCFIFWTHSINLPTELRLFPSPCTITIPSLILFKLICFIISYIWDPRVWLEVSGCLKHCLFRSEPR